LFEGRDIGRESGDRHRLRRDREQQELILRIRRSQESLYDFLGGAERMITMLSPNWLFWEFLRGRLKMSENA
jgi:hypothetical protein